MDRVRSIWMTCYRESYKVTNRRRQLSHSSPSQLYCKEKAFTSTCTLTLSSPIFSARKVSSSPSLSSTLRLTLRPRQASSLTRFSRSLFLRVEKLQLLMIWASRSATLACTSIVTKAIGGGSRTLNALLIS